MKKLLLFSIVFSSTGLVSCLAHAGEQAAPLTIAIVIDTSPTRRWPELVAVAQNLYKSCHAGDTILFFSVRSKRSHLRFSCIKRLNDYEFEDFSSILKTISPDWFLRAHIGSALKNPIYQKLLQRAGPKGHAVVAIVTEGNLGQKQARDICKFADDIKAAHNWTFLITGTTSKTNRELLVAASKGRLHWLSLNEAVERVTVDNWMRQARPTLESTAKDDTVSPKSVIADTEANRSEKASSSAKSKLLSADSEPAKKVESSRAAPQTKAGKPTEPARRESGKGSLAGHSKPTSDRPAPSPSKKSSPVRKSMIPTVLMGRQADRKKQATSPSSAPESFEGQSKTKSKPSRPSKTPALGKDLMPRLLAVGGLSIISMIALLLLSGWLNAKSLQKRLLAPVQMARRQGENEPKILMVQFNGTLYRIGNLRRIRSFHMGASSENTIRLNNKAAAPRHVRVFRRRGDLFIRNLAKVPLVVNGRQLAQHKKCPLALPAIVDIADDVKVRLFWEKGPAKSVTSKVGGQRNATTNQ